MSLLTIQCCELNVFFLCLQSADTVKMLSATQQTQEEVERTKHQLSFEIDRIKQESDMRVGSQLKKTKRLKVHMLKCSE